MQYQKLKNFYATDTSKAGTNNLIPKILNFREFTDKNNEEFCFIDTVGFKHADGYDPSGEMAAFLKEIEHVNLFLFVLSCYDDRFDENSKSFVNDLC